LSNVIQFPPSAAWKQARDARSKLYNNPAWYSPHWWVRDTIEAEWEKLTLVMRQEEIRANRGSRDKYRLPS